MTRISRLVSFFLCVFLVLTLIPFLVHAAPDTYQLQFDCNKPDFYVKGETITIYGRANGSVSLTLNVFWNWKSFSDNILVYNNTRVANTTWTLPTTNSNVGYYRFVLLGANQTVTIWRTLVHYTGYQADSLPFNYSWQGVNYTLQGRHLYAQSNNEWLNLTYPKIPVQFSVNFFRNNMTFLVRLSGSSWAVDVSYMALYSSLKWTINGTLDNPQTFEFECANNPLGKWAKRLDQWKGAGFLTFDWSDIRRVGQAFTWSNGVLSVDIPSSFSIDPYIFSDGFESGNLTAWTATTTYGTGTVAASSLDKHTGTYSALVTGATSDANAALCYKDLTGSETTTYVRFYLKLTTFSPSNGQYCRFALMKGVGGWMVWYLQLTNTVRNLTLLYNTNADALQTLTSNTACLSLNIWYCLEVKLYRHATAGEYRVYLDGNEVIDLAATSLATNSIGSISLIGFGNAYPRSYSGGFIAYYDCFVVDSSYIGPEVSGQDLTFPVYQSLYPSAYNLFGKELAFSTSHSIFPSGTGYFWKAIGFQTSLSILPSATNSFNKALEILATGTIKLWDSGTSAISLIVTTFENCGSIIIQASSTLPTIISATIDMAIAIGVLALVLAITGISLVVLRKRRE